MNIHNPSRPTRGISPSLVEIGADTLAWELAQRLGDDASHSFFRTVVRNYSERTIRSALERALAMPADKLHVSRGALFNWLLRSDPKPLPRRTLGIDPGAAHIGWAVLDDTTLLAADVAD